MIRRTGLNYGKAPAPARKKQHDAGCCFFAGWFAAE